MKHSINCISNARVLLFVFVLLNVTSSVWAQVARDVFSGPQVGEKLPPLLLEGVLPKKKQFDPVKLAGDKPVLLMFLHRKTRPAFGLMNAIARYSTTRKKDGLSTDIVMLTDDAPDTKKWLNQIKRYFADGARVSYSADGIDGPGAYGLNRKDVELTILVAKAGRVVANFALTQPSDEVDGPKILKAIVDVLGGGEVPKLRERNSRMRMQAARPTREIGRLLNRLAKPETPVVEQEAALKKLRLLAGNPANRAGFLTAVRQKLKDADADKNTIPQNVVPELKKLEQQVSGAMAVQRQLRPMFSPLIKKDATKIQVDTAAKKIVDWLNNNPAAKKEVGRVASTIVRSGKLGNYGTSFAQDYLRKWASQFGPKNSEQNNGRQEKSTQKKQ